MEAAAVLCRCETTRKMFGIRFEKREKVWFYNWAFPVKESNARNEGYDHTRVEGELARDPEYPGCLSCGAPGFFRCSCGKMTCWDGKKPEAVCAWCGRASKIRDDLKSLEGTTDY